MTNSLRQCHRHHHHAADLAWTAPFTLAVPTLCGQIRTRTNLARRPPPSLSPRPGRALPLRRARRLPMTLRVTACLPPPTALDPPNADADWVIVDLSVDGVPAETLPAPQAALIHDDAKSLVRVALRDAPCELSILLCPDSRIRSLNSHWRANDAATDVLSFPQHDDDGIILGDIVISVDTAARQAAAAAHSLRHELRILLVHGLLHLLGYDHEGKTQGDWLLMAQMENKLLRALNWEGEGLTAATLHPSYKPVVE